MGEVVSMLTWLREHPEPDHGCLGDRNGKCCLCEVRSLDEVRRRVDLPADCEPVRAE